MRPLKNYALVVEAQKETTTAGGLIIAAGAEVGSKKGVVLAIGPDVKEVKIGDNVAVAWDKGLVIEQNGERGILVPEEFIYGVY